MNYAEQNRQVLLRCEPDQYILINTPERVLEALRKGELVAPKHYWPNVIFKRYMRTMILSLVLAMLLFVPFILVDRSFLTVIGVGVFFPLFMLFISIFFILFFGRLILPAKRLNKLWAEGRLVTSQHVEAGDARNSDYRYEVRYEFSAPDGERITGWNNIDHIKTRAKRQPTMLMIYKSPREYIVL